ncbi:MAG: Alpha/Beta hydrolase protein [Monoraphidium minutum]|nr:MAG: Alpha/Beta hydrolase protein [Monoraphidium minutum]
MGPSGAPSVASAKAEGDALFRQGLHDAAARAYSDALKLSEAAGDASLLALLHANRAAAHLALGAWQPALADALCSLAVDDAYAKSHFRAAVALEKLGRGHDALRHAARAADLDPSSRDAAALTRRLRAAGAGGGGGGSPKRHMSPGQRQQPLGAALAAAWGAATARDANAAAGSSEGPQPITAPITEARALALLPPQMRGGSCFVPPPDGSDANLLLLFHGLGDKPTFYAALARHMALPQTAALALAAPLPLPRAGGVGGGGAWFTAFDDSFHLIRPSPGEQRRARALRATTDALLPLLPALAGARGGGGPPRRRLHLFGFSQGGCVALELARRVIAAAGDAGPPAWLGSVVSISGCVLEESLPALEAEAQRQRQEGGGGQGGGGGARRLPVLITHGDKDETVLRSYIDRSAALLRGAGCDVTFHSVPGKRHAMVGSDRAEAEALMAFYSRALAAAPPGEGYVEVA